MWSHYQKQCWNIVNRAPGNIFQWNLDKNTTIFIHENTFEKSSAKCPFRLVPNVLIKVTIWRRTMKTDVSLVWPVTLSYANSLHLVNDTVGRTVPKTMVTQQSMHMWVSWHSHYLPITLGTLTSSIITDAKPVDSNLVDLDRKTCMDQPGILHNNSS